MRNGCLMTHAVWSQMSRLLFDSYYSSHKMLMHCGGLLKIEKERKEPGLFVSQT